MTENDTREQPNWNVADPDSLLDADATPTNIYLTHDATPHVDTTHVAGVFDQHTPDDASVRHG